MRRRRIEQDTGDSRLDYFGVTPLPMHDGDSEWLGVTADGIHWRVRVGLWTFLSTHILVPLAQPVGRKDLKPFILSGTTYGNVNGD